MALEPKGFLNHREEIDIPSRSRDIPANPFEGDDFLRNFQIDFRFIALSLRFGLNLTYWKNLW
jgi:hypothetical protein